MLRKVNKWKTDSGKRNSFSTKTIRHCQMVPQLIERRNRRKLKIYLAFFLYHLNFQLLKFFVLSI